ncbi:MAG: hypothetical protein DRO99_01760 [Candidatus Aenigmatarchaeota archaeon]|nr:MAG: hypothetical protein DRO99_01760 [Candidatus Aenigmarchaeota archaeon]
MKPFCEVVALELLPAVRAMVARKLTGKYGISQRRAAYLLGVSQPAISQYRKDLRGYKSKLFKNNPKLSGMVDAMAECMASGDVDSPEATLSFCELCKEIRFSGAGCETHHNRYQSLASCSVCMDNKEFYGKHPPKARK